jgi:hypothetical protein
MKSVSMGPPFALLLAAAMLAPLAVPAHAITLGQLDDFEDGTTMGWRGNTTENAADEGPLGVGDDALQVNSFQRLLTVSDLDQAFQPTQWRGDYMAAGVTRISMDVRNPNEFDLKLLLGIADDTLSTFGSGASYLTNYSITVPADDDWHSVVFSILPDDFVPSAANTESPPAGAGAVLGDVFQLRILHSTFPGDFRGDEVFGHFFLDNMAAIPEPATGTMAAVTAAGWPLSCRRRQLRRHT